MSDDAYADADQRYLEVAEDNEISDFFQRVGSVSRAPYSAGEVLCRGATFYPKFKEVSAFANCQRCPRVPDPSGGRVSALNLAPQYVENGGLGK